MNRNGITISDKLLDFNKQIQQARKELKAKAKHIGHMVGMEDSVYRTGDIDTKVEETIAPEEATLSEAQIKELKAIMLNKDGKLKASFAKIAKKYELMKDC